MGYDHCLSVLLFHRHRGLTYCKFEPALNLDLFYNTDAIVV